MPIQNPAGLKKHDDLVQEWIARLNESAPPGFTARSYRDVLRALGTPPSRLNQLDGAFGDIELVSPDRKVVLRIDLKNSPNLAYPTTYAFPQGTPEHERLADSHDKAYLFVSPRWPEGRLFTKSDVKENLERSPGGTLVFDFIRSRKLCAATGTPELWTLAQDMWAGA